MKSADLRQILATLPIDQRCDPSCPGWFPSDGDRGLRVERCDECEIARRALGLPEVLDTHVARLPEARDERARVLADRALRVRGVTYATLGMTDGTRSTWRVYRVAVRGYPRPIKSLDPARGTLIAAPTFTTTADYAQRQRDLAAQYAIPAWPAFAWT